MVAIQRGLGFAGSYIGGDHNADRIRWIIERSEVLAPQWEELAAELEFAPKGGFYFFESPKGEPQKQTFWKCRADQGGAAKAVLRKSTPPVARPIAP